jgi:hypothetical protein
MADNKKTPDELLKELSKIVENRGDHRKTLMDVVSNIATSNTNYHSNNK